MWFSFDGVDFHIHQTELEAQSNAEQALRYCAEDAADGWPEEVHHIFWGKVSQTTMITHDRPAVEGDACYPQCDQYQEIELVDVEK